MIFRRSIFKVNWVDALTLLLAIACLALFSFHSWDYERSTGIYAPIAVLDHGSAERKESGSSDFISAQPGTQFLNLDVIWVPPGQKATLRMDDSSIAELEEKTLVVLKKPFKGGSDPREKLKTIQGKVILFTSRGEPLVIEDSPLFKELPDPKKVSNTLVENKAISPISGTVFFARQGTQIPLTLSWKTSYDGFLVISRNDSQAPIYRTLKQQQSAEIPFEIDHDYLWQVLGTNQKVLTGPYRFSLRKFSEAEVRKVLLQGGSGKVQILMESGQAAP